MSDTELWPSLPLNEWRDTYDTLHLWTQIAGKIRMTLSPPLNHWWHVTFYVNSRGLTTGPIPYPAGVFEIEFDFVKHVLRISASEGRGLSRKLKPESVADFYRHIFDDLATLGIAVTIDPMPQEISGAVPFDRDSTHCWYDPEYAHRFWRILVPVSKVRNDFARSSSESAAPSTSSGEASISRVLDFPAGHAPLRRAMA